MKIKSLKNLGLIIILAFLLSPFLIYRSVLLLSMVEDSIVGDTLTNEELQNLHSLVFNNIYSYVNYLKINRNYNEIINGGFDQYLFSDKEENYIDPTRDYGIIFELQKDTQFFGYNVYAYYWYGMNYTESIKIDSANKVLIEYYKKLHNYDSVHYVLHANFARSMPAKDTLISYITPLIETGLIGYNRKTKKLVFISGFMFLNNVIYDIMDGKINQEKVRKYVEMRYFNYLPKELAIKEITHEKEYKILFYSALVSKNFEVTIFYNDTLKAYKESILEKKE